MRVGVVALEQQTGKRRAGRQRVEGRVQRRNRDHHGKLAEVLARDALQAEGDLGPGSNPAALARYIATVEQGMAVQAASGATREDLLAVAEMALNAWPSQWPSGRTRPAERSKH